MLLSEWREFPSAPCLAGKKKIDHSSRLDVVEIARVPDMLPSLFPSLVEVRTYQHLGYYLSFLLFVVQVYGLLPSLLGSFATWRKDDSELPYVRSSTEQLGAHLMDFHEI